MNNLPHRLHCALSLVLLIGASGCASTASIPLRSPARLTTAGFATPIRTVVIDAGHGGHDPGTSHHGLKEKRLALDIAKRLRTYLQNAGLKVIMTRDSDKFIPLSKRAALANRTQADLFISVHINANRSRWVSGIEAYYPRVSVITSSRQWPPFVRTREVAIRSTTIKQVLWDLVLGRTRSQSKRLATSICHAMRDNLRAPCRAIKPARFVVLREAWMPAVLVEVGYLSNKSEAGRLRRSQYRQVAAKSIAQGIVSYIRQLGVQHI